MPRFVFSILCRSIFWDKHEVHQCNAVKVEKVLKGSLDSIITFTFRELKIQIMGGKVCLRCKVKTLLGDVNKLFFIKSLMIMPSNILLLHLKQIFPSIIWIFTEGEGNEIKSRLPFKTFSTLSSWWLLNLTGFGCYTSHLYFLIFCL